VDDNTRYRGQLRRMIGKACPQSLIHEADSMHKALRLAGQHPIQLALVDVVLGHDSESGIQCARRLRALDPQMRVVLISAYPDREFHRQGLEARLCFGQKDLDVATLRQVVDDINTSNALNCSQRPSAGQHPRRGCLQIELHPKPLDLA
jgi:DNA-binding NarL/FixJ family response regulator